VDDIVRNAEMMVDLFEHLRAVSCPELRGQLRARLERRDITPRLHRSGQLRNRPQTSPCTRRLEPEPRLHGTAAAHGRVGGSSATSVRIIEIIAYAAGKAERDIDDARELDYCVESKRIHFEHLGRNEYESEAPGQHGLDPFVRRCIGLATIAGTPLIALDALLPDRRCANQFEEIAEA